MPGFIVHQGATIKCAHGGQVEAVAPISKVLLGGQPIVVQPVPHMIAGCPHTVGSSAVPCVTANWVSAATRVKSFGSPVLLLDSQAVCIPNSTPVTITTTQTKVSAI